MIQTIQLKTMKETAPPSAVVLCLGNFDGVHLGHRKLAEETKKRKDLLSVKHPGVASGVWFFRQPPSRFLSGKAIPQITTVEDKLFLFAELGLDYAFLADFSELKDLSPADFTRQVLREECRCIFTVCGYNFRFGANAAGDAEELVRLMGGNGEILDPVTLGGIPVSSSAVRQKMAEGDTEEAERLLGHPYFLRSEVIHGKALGHTIGFPTVNQLFPADAMRPADGVYISGTWIDGVLFPSVSNIGKRPTFENSRIVNCETHIIGHNENLYGRILKIDFYKRLRDEIVFPSIAELNAQLIRDVASAKAYFQTERGQSE